MHSNTEQREGAHGGRHHPSCYHIVAGPEQVEPLTLDESLRKHVLSALLRSRGSARSKSSVAPAEHTQWDGSILHAVMPTPSTVT